LADGQFALGVNDIEHDDVHHRDLKDSKKHWKIDISKVLIGSGHTLYDEIDHAYLQSESPLFTFPSDSYKEFKHNFIPTSCFKADDVFDYETKEFICRCNGGTPSGLPKILIELGDKILGFYPDDYVLDTYIEPSIS
jgi:hypothetical protein